MEGLLREHGTRTAVVYMDGNDWTAAIYESGMPLALDGESAAHIEPDQDKAKAWALTQIHDSDSSAPWTPISFGDAPLPPNFGLWS